MNPFRLFKPNIEKMEKKGDIEGMMKAMDYPNAGVCIGAQEALIRIGEPAVETLIRALKDQERAQVRYNAITVLGWIEGKRAVGPLIQALKDESSSVRQLAARVLGEKGDSRAVEPLIQALKDENTDARNAAERALKAIVDARAVEPLIQALRDEDLLFRFYVKWVLVEIRDAKAVEPLIQALKDEDTAVREAAAEALGAIGDAKAVEPLIQALKDEDTAVRKTAAGALGAIGEVRAVEPLIQALKDEDRDVRKTAAGALGELGTAEAVEPLKRALKDTDGSVRKAAKDALKKMGVETHEKGIQTLEELCTEMGILDPMAYVNRAVEELKPHGADASRALAELIGELLDCRSPKITLVLMAAEQLHPTPELIEAVRSVKSARGLVRQPTRGRFSPEIAGRGQVGWTDGTEDRIRRFAAQVLEKLTRENAQ